MRESRVPSWPWRPRVEEWPRLADLDVVACQVEARHPQYFIESVDTLSPQWIPYSLEGARRLSARAKVELCRRWSAFSTGAFDHLLRLMRKDAFAAQTLLHTLPRASGESLWLSALDQSLLKPFRRWRTPSDLR